MGGNCGNCWTHLSRWIYFRSWFSHQVILSCLPFDLWRTNLVHTDQLSTSTIQLKEGNPHDYCKLPSAVFTESNSQQLSATVIDPYAAACLGLRSRCMQKHEVQRLNKHISCRKWHNLWNQMGQCGWAIEKMVVVCYTSSILSLSCYISVCNFPVRWFIYCCMKFTSLIYVHTQRKKNDRKQRNILGWWHLTKIFQNKMYTQFVHITNVTVVCLGTKPTR